MKEDLNRIKKLAGILEYEEDEEIFYSKPFKKTISGIVKSLYPGVKFKIKIDEDDYIAITTDDEQKFSFYIGVSHQYGDNVISVAQAYAGKYRGIVGRTVAAAVDFLKKRHPDATTTLSVQHDASGDYWRQLATKLGIEYEENRWY